MLENYETLLYSKAWENASPAGERFSYGYCVGKVEQIRPVEIEREGPQQAIEIYPVYWTMTRHESGRPCPCADYWI